MKEAVATAGAHAFELSTQVITDALSSRSKGYGFVRFGDEKERDRSLAQMQGHFIASRPIRVSLATAKRAPPGIMQPSTASRDGIASPFLKPGRRSGLQGCHTCLLSTSNSQWLSFFTGDARCVSFDSTGEGPHNIGSFTKLSL